MNVPLADYRGEVEAFRALLAPEAQRRILLFFGESGCGKTRLLQHCLSQVPEEIPYVPIQMRGSVVGVGEIFSRAGQRLNWERLPNFTRQVAALDGTAHIQIDRNWLAGIANRINVTLQMEDMTARRQRREGLTEAWFQDMREFESPLLMVWDTYEQATAEVQDWISGPFLARVEQVSQLRVLVAGREVPDPNTIEWGHCCAAHELLGVPEAEHWWPVVEAMGLQIDVPDPKSWLAGVCSVLKGRPHEIMMHLEGLRRQEGGR